MGRPGRSPDLLVRLQMVLAAWNNHQKNRPVTDEFLAEIVGKTPTAITQMLKKNPALDELLSTEDWCNGNEPEQQPLQDTLEQLTRLLGITDVLHIKKEQPVNELPLVTEAEALEIAACPPAEAVEHTTMALAASDSAVLTRPAPKPEVEQPQEAAVEEPVVEGAEASVSSVVRTVIAVERPLVTKPVLELTCSLPTPVVERMLIPNHPTPAVRPPHQVVVHEVSRGAVPRGPIRGPRQSAFPVTHSRLFGPEEAGWKQSLRLSNEITVTVDSVRQGRVVLKKLSPVEYVCFWNDKKLEFQHKGQTKPDHLPSPEELEEFLTLLKTPA